MKISEAIKELEAIKANYGDLQVTTLFVNGEVKPLKHMGLKYIAIPQGKKRRTIYWNDWYKPEDYIKGNLVVSV